MSLFRSKTPVEETLDSDSSDNYPSNTEANDSYSEPEVLYRQYPWRERGACQNPDNIPWDALRNREGEMLVCTPVTFIFV